VNQSRRTLARLAVAATVGLAMVLSTAAGPAAAAPETSRTATPSAALGKVAAKPDKKITITIRPATPKPVQGARSQLPLWPPIGPPAPIATPLEVIAYNQTGLDYDEIWLAYNTFSNPIASVWPRAPFLNGQQQSWSIPGCRTVNLYAIALVYNNVIEFNTGNISPDSCLEQVVFHG
jgi:hypothetical protein